MREGTCAGKEKISEPVVAWIYPSATRISVDITLIFSTTRLSSSFNSRLAECKAQVLPGAAGFNGAFQRGGPWN